MFIHRCLVFLAMLAALAALSVGPARAGQAEDVVALYERFAAAQNRRDVASVRSLLDSSERFLWVSNGQAFWGADTMVARMSQFQEAEVWEVRPDRSRRVFVSLGPDTAHLYQPLTLRIGPAAGPDEIPFLVDVLCVRTADGWRIAALLTTTENR